jgi:hypothetical protein
MKRFMGVTVGAVLLVAVTALSADAGGGYHGGGYHGGGYHGGAYHAGGYYKGGYHGGYYGGTRVFIGGWWGPGWWGPGWWGAPYPYAYPYPYPYYSTPPAVIQQAPQEYIQQGSAPPQQSYWYYCPNPQGYYPYIKECPSGWLQVVPQPTPPPK